MMPILARIEQMMDFTVESIGMKTYTADAFALQFIWWYELFLDMFHCWHHVSTIFKNIRLLGKKEKIKSLIKSPSYQKKLTFGE